MISVVIATLNNERTLGRTLAGLVPGVVDGLVREVIVADGGSTDHTLDVAEDAGVKVIAGKGASQTRLAEGATAAKGDWLLFLTLEKPLAAGWTTAVEAHIRSRPGEAAWWTATNGWFGGKPQGILLPKAMAAAKAKGRRLKIRY